MTYIDNLTNWFDKNLSTLSFDYDFPVFNFHGYQKIKATNYCNEVGFIRYCYRNCQKISQEKAFDFLVEVMQKYYKLEKACKKDLIECYNSLNSYGNVISGKRLTTGSILASCVDLYRKPIFYPGTSAVLNAIQYVISQESGYFFPDIDELNDKSKNHNNFLTEKKLVNELSWRKIDKDDIYHFYTITLNECLNKLLHYEIYDLALCLRYHGKSICHYANYLSEGVSE